MIEKRYILICFIGLALNFSTLELFAENTLTAGDSTNHDISSKKTAKDKISGLNPVFTRSLLYGAIGAGAGFLVSIPVVISINREPGDPGITQSIIIAGLTGLGATAGLVFGAQSGYERKKSLESEIPVLIQKPPKKPTENEISDFYISLSQGYSQIKNGWKNSTTFSIISNPWKKMGILPDYYSIEFESANWSLDTFSGREGRLGVMGIYKFIVLNQNYLFLTAGIGGGITIAKHEKTTSYLPFIAGFSGIEVQVYDLLLIGVQAEFQPIGAHFVMMKDQFALKQLFTVKATLGIKLFSY
ncbi:MAG: hypothetical protein J0L62_02165 [Bacteroidetes bacterium]|nr:hypothetical protein [Bacteroidota bacterium]